MKIKNLEFKKDSTFDKCPKCGKVGKLHRSRGRNWFEHALKKTGVWDVYRCRECGWRSYKSNFSLRKLSFKTLAIYLLLILITAIVVRFIILRFVIK